MTVPVLQAGAGSCARAFAEKGRLPGRRTGCMLKKAVFGMHRLLHPTAPGTDLCTLFVPCLYFVKGRFENEESADHRKEDGTV